MIDGLGQQLLTGLAGRVVGSPLTNVGPTSLPPQPHHYHRPSRNCYAHPLFSDSLDFFCHLVFVQLFCVHSFNWQRGQGHPRTLRKLSLFIISWGSKWPRNALFYPLLSIVAQFDRDMVYQLDYSFCLILPIHSASCRAKPPSFSLLVALLIRLPTISNSNKNEGR